MAGRLVLAAPAKVNLFLHVTGRRADGYHLLESLFALVDLADTVTVEPRDDDAIVRSRDLPGVAPDDDLAMRAAKALREASGVRRGVSIAVDKRIPLGAGLGGGSSDAATVLLALNRIWGLGLSREALAAVGATLGADVPFFVHGQNAIVRGIGEIVRPVSLPVQWLALAIPRVPVATASIFASPELTRSTPSAKINVFSESYGRNDLEPVAASRHPDVARTIAMLQSHAPDARMTGSGGAAFAACGSASQAQRIVESIAGTVDARVVATLSRHPLAGFAA
jgi:4-diphosphocytidyl-2-C-methyl-D-erythritol kinase